VVSVAGSPVALEAAAGVAVAVVVPVDGATVDVALDEPQADATMLAAASKARTRYLPRCIPFLLPHEELSTSKCA
jgi:hypothetical protein